MISKCHLLNEKKKQMMKMCHSGGESDAVISFQVYHGG